MTHENLADATSAELYAACNDPKRQTAAFTALWRYLYRVTIYVVRDQPSAEALAAECAQIALIRIHRKLAHCREPDAFKTWARRIASHIAIDELRRRKRLAPLPDDLEGEEEKTTADDSPLPADIVFDEMGLAELRQLLNQSPMSARSKRVVIGRYLDDLPDELLAQQESDLTGRDVQPSHIQVTRAKNIATLRGWDQLLDILSN